MLKFLSISSGSSGNCYYLGNEQTALLVDVGVGYRTIKQRMASVGVDINTVEMIMITHDHVDHIKGLGSVTSRLSVPVFATSTLHTAIERKCTAVSIYGCRRVVKKDFQFENRGVKFVPFEVPHDATETLGYFIDFFGTKFVFLTDLGKVPDKAIQYCRIADYIILESNYDVDMLIHGPYPIELRARIMGEIGHLSNEDCARVLRLICPYNENLKGVFLCHISKENNTHDKAYQCSLDSLQKVNIRVPEDISLVALPRTEIAEFNL